MHTSLAHGRRIRRLGGLLVTVTGCVAALTVAARPAAAAAPGPHDPFGAVTKVTAVSGGLRFTGWALDPDAVKTNDTVSVYVDGRTVTATAATSVVNASVTSTYKAGRTPGFTITGPVAAGPHTVCVDAHTIGSGLDTVLKCVTTPLATKLTAAQLAKHDPAGAITHAGRNSKVIRLQGWASDPDLVARRSTVVLYVDAAPAATVTTQAYPLPRPATAGYRSAFDIQVPVSKGAHLGCIWVVNIGLGANSFLGCKALDTRGLAGTGPITTPSLNPKVLAEAKKHIGQRYVWGATGPKTFDCSGLVMYSYGKFGYATPRVSEAQFAAARLIPASRAVPGDLVFTHDTEGDVYHVGIYVSPGRSVAAIDTDEGVNYQQIWDPADTTYGSFTHT
jgi:cell wall-associated NlpC family hydrolase